MPKTTDAISNTSLRLEDLDLLSLPSIEAHPAVQQAIEDKEPLSARLAILEEALLNTRKRMAFAASSGNDPGTAAEMIQKAREELATLEQEHNTTIAALRIANSKIKEVTAATRQQLIPELATVALPEIEARLHGLVVLDAVQRLVGRSTPLRTVRESFKMERRYLTELKDLLTAGGSA